MDALSAASLFKSPAVQPSKQDPAALAQAGQDFVKTLNAAETTAEAAMTGRADSQALVEALAASEIAVETAVTVRDKVVEAYNEILRMPV
jgi:flagellar hook-basal body complex protein FliE